MSNLTWTNITSSYAVCNYKNQSITIDDSIAAYDLDHTIIMPKTGKMFTNKKENEWEFLPYIIDNIKRDLALKNSKFMIITNQKNLNKKELEYNIWKLKIESVLATIDIPCIVLASFRDDRYRKPSPYILLDNYQFKKTDSFYCGDAGGIYVDRNYKAYNKTIHHEKDFSDTDLKFALNIGVDFIHRDKYLYNDTSKPSTLIYPDIKAAPTNKTLTTISYNPQPNITPEVVIFVGAAGCGKSTLSKKYETIGYTIINQDTLKTFKKCISEFTRLISLGKSVVIDNTNPAKKTRAEYIRLVSDIKKYKLHCVHFNVKEEQCRHNNIYRHITNPSREIVPSIAYGFYRKNFELPSIKEGFDTITTLEFDVDSSIRDKPEYNYYYF